MLVQTLVERSSMLGGQVLLPLEKEDEEYGADNHVKQGELDKA